MADSDDGFSPKYVQLPQWRQRGAGPRNLGWGVGLLLVGAILLGVALYLAGPRVMIPVATCVATATLLYVLARARVFRQRNGSFLAASLVFVLAAILALIEHGWTLLQQPGHREAAPSSSPGIAAVVPKSSAPEETPSLIEAFKLQPPEKTARRVKILKDSRVVIDGKTYLIRAGDEFAYAGNANGDVRFTAGEQQIALPSDLVEVSEQPDAAKPAAGQAAAAGASTGAHAPEAPTPTQLTENAQREAIRRYPALGVKDSPENQLYVETYQGLKNSGATDFFERPDWPLRLAESLAQKEGWERQDGANPPPPQSNTEPSRTPTPAPQQDPALPEQ